MIIKEFKNLPKGIQQRIRVIHPNDYEIWVNNAIPALNNCSIIETINKEDGISAISKYLNKVEGYIGIKR